MNKVIDRMARESDAEFARLTGVIFDLVKALERIADMEPATQEMTLAHMMAAEARDAIAAVGGVGNGS